jgi:hypothetical protein
MTGLITIIFQGVDNKFLLFAQDETNFCAKGEFLNAILSQNPVSLQDCVLTGIAIRNYLPG